MDTEDSVLPIEYSKVSSRETGKRDDTELRAADVGLNLELEDVWCAQDERGRHPIGVLPDVFPECRGMSLADAAVPLRRVGGIGGGEQRRHLGERQINREDLPPPL